MKVELCGLAILTLRPRWRRPRTASSATCGERNGHHPPTPQTCQDPAAHLILGGLGLGILSPFRGLLDITGWEPAENGIEKELWEGIA
jgi:hypothetical protein